MLMLCSHLLSCTAKTEASEPVQDTEEQAPERQNIAPEQCFTKEYWSIEGAKFKELPWKDSIHDYESPRFEQKGQRKANQKNTKKLIESTVTALGGPAVQSRFFQLIAERESSLIGTEIPFDGMGVVHRLDADEQAAGQTAKAYREDLESHAYGDQPELWKTYGPYGTNSVYGIGLLHKDLDPRSLGDTVLATLVQINRVRYVAAKLDGDIMCPVYEDKPRTYYNASGVEAKEGVYKRDENRKIIRSSKYIPLTWYNLHRGVQSGRVCPRHPKSTVSRFLRRGFEARAKRHRIDPDGKVPKLARRSESILQDWISVWSMNGVTIERAEERDCNGEDTSKDSEVTGAE